MSHVEDASAQGGWNYFNYFTEIEDHFRRARGTGLFLLSPIDWALIETWKGSDIPLEAVLRGIDVAFEKWRNRKNKLQQVNSIAYCAQAVYAEAQAMAGGSPASAKKQTEAPFTLDDLREYLKRNATQLRASGSVYEEIAAALDRISKDAGEHYGDLEQLEQRLTALEEKMSAIAKSHQTEEALFEARRELESTLRPYRGKMTADQLAMLERQYLEKRVMESAGLPRLSLFYLR